MLKYLEELSLIYENAIVNSQYLLSEMYVIGDDYDSDYFIVAHRDKIFKLDLNIGKTGDNVLSSMAGEFNVNIDDLKTRTGVDSLISLIAHNNKQNLNILYGYYVKSENKMIVLNRYFQTFKNLNESNLVKKVYKQLNLSKVVLQSDINIGFTRDDLQGKEPYNLFYHGTTSEYIEGILRKGIDNKTSNTNFSHKIKSLNSNKLFITSNFQYALNHAVTVATSKGGYPIVIEFKIRMPDLLQPDYDVQKYSGASDIEALKMLRFP